MPKQTDRERCREQGLPTYRGYPCKRGHSGIRYVSHGQCVDCYQERLAALRNRQYGSRGRHPAYELLKEAKKRAKQYNREFNLDLDDIEVPKLCPISGKPLIKHTRDAPSLDRIDNTKGYVPGNVWVISHRINCIKGSGTVEELRAIADHMERHQAAMALVE